MKSIIAVALAATTLSLASCGENHTDDTMTTTSSETTAVLTEQPMAVTTTTTRTPSEGDVTYTSGRVQVYRGNAWTDANEDIKLDNDIVIYRDGRARRNNVDVEWEEGYVVDRQGNVWDRTGNAIGDAWDATKHGVKKAGKAVGNAAEKVGEKAKDVVD